jgi:hypothetical protein
MAENQAAASSLGKTIKNLPKRSVGRPGDAMEISTAEPLFRAKP